MVTDVPEQHIAPIFKDVLGCLTVEEWTDKLSRNVGNQIPNYAPLTSQKSEGLSYMAAGA
jgi:hypothetical protein